MTGCAAREETEGRTAGCGRTEGGAVEGGSRRAAGIGLTPTEGGRALIAADDEMEGGGGRTLGGVISEVMGSPTCAAEDRCRTKGGGGNELDKDEEPAPRGLAMLAVRGLETLIATDEVLRRGLPSLGLLTSGFGPRLDVTELLLKGDGGGRGEVDAEPLFAFCKVATMSSRLEPCPMCRLCDTFWTLIAAP